MNDMWTVKLFQFSPSREGGQNAFITANQEAQFQFSPSREGGLKQYNLAVIFSIHFNSRPRVRAVCKVYHPPSLFGRFQFSPSREGGRTGDCSRRNHFNFNSRPRVRAVYRPLSTILSMRHFNSRPRVRAVLSTATITLNADISILALA